MFTDRPMSRIQRVLKNVAVLYVARGTTTILKFVSFVYIARILGDATLGKFTLAIVLAGLFAIPMNFGMDDLLVRQVARDRSTSSKYIGNIVPLRIILGTIMFASLLVLVNVVHYPRDTRLAIIIFGVQAFISVVGSLYRSNFRAFESMEWDALLDIVENVIATAASLLLLFAGFGLIEISCAFLLSALVSLLLAYIICTRRITKTRIELDLAFWKQLIKNAAPYGLYSIFLMASIRIDAVMISAMRGDTVLGWYNAAYQIVLALEPAASLFMSALIPVISRLFVSSDQMLQFTYAKSVEYLAMLGIPTAVGCTMLAGRIIPLLYGAGFDNSIIAFQILIWIFLLACINRPMLYTLGATNRQGTMAMIVIMGTSLNIGLNYFAISLWGYVGAAITAVVTASLMTVASWYAAAKYVHRIRILRTVFRPVIASLAMGGVLYLGIRFTTVHVLLLLLSGLAVYFPVLFLVGGISHDDRDLFRQAVSIWRAAK